MGRLGTTLNSARRVLALTISVCLVLSLMPSVAFADTRVSVKADQPEQVNKTVAIESNPTEEQSPQDSESTKTEAPKGDANEQEPIHTNDVPKVDSPASKHSQITTDVVVGVSTDTQAETLLVDGLTYLVDHASESATLTGWYGSAPTGDLSVPAQVSDGNVIFRVENAGGGTF